jgi:uncharacterized protein (TIGR03086 family)
MSTEPLAKAIASTRALLTTVTAEDLGRDTPCASWKVSDLINHIVGAQQFFTAGLRGTPPSPSGDATAGDFVAAFDDATSATLAAFGEDGVMTTMYTLPFGQMPGAAFVGLATMDAFTHGWDLAKSLGRPTDLDPELAAALLAQAKASISPAFRGEDGKAPFTAEQPAPEGCTAADQLAAFLGRTV